MYMPPAKTATALTTVHIAIWYSNRALSVRNLPIAYAELPAHTIAKMRSPDAVKLAALLGSKTFAGMLLTSTPLICRSNLPYAHIFFTRHSTNLMIASVMDRRTSAHTNIQKACW